MLAEQTLLALRARQLLRFAQAIPGSPVAVTERTNRAMRQRTSQALPATGLEPSLQMLLDAGFVECDGGVFLAAEVESAPDGDLLDQTGREALVNHIHIEDRIVQRAGADLVGQVLHYARSLAERLVSAFPGDAFHVVLAIGDSSTVRFYRLRANEPPWISADLVSYTDEAVLVLTLEWLLLSQPSSSREPEQRSVAMRELR